MKAFKTKSGTELPILNLKGKDYLEVKYRLVWFREDHPTWSIETELVTNGDKLACAKAVIKDESGRIIATSHKMENQSHFPDFLEKAETGAIGRALALIGYGTQFCGDELDEGSRIVDAPVDPRSSLPSIKPEQPTPMDGNQNSGQYIVNFGTKFNGKSIEWIVNNVDHKVIESYVDWLTNNADASGKPLTKGQQEFITRVSNYIGALENGPGDAAKSYGQH